jgi:aminomethyltransferase
MDVEVVDISSKLVALALQGPNSREILKQILSGIDLYALRYYRLANAQVSRFPLSVTRTGYTGDLGYELWIEPEYALGLWSALVEAGSRYSLLPAGIVALDMARVEAGLLLIEVDYISSRKALIPEQVSTPYELGLGWTVDLEKGYFIGREALLEEKRHGSQWAFVGLEIDWGSLEALFAAVDLPPLVAGRASRSALPVYQNGRHIGQATSHVFSPLLKKYIALASLQAPFARLGSVVQIEITVEYVRHTANAVVTALPFYDPLRKRS